MPASTARTLTFTIPGSPALKVIATENNGKIDFTLDVQDTTQLTGDLRGFFFDTNEAKMSGMKVTGSSLLTQAKVGANAQLDLGNGDTMAAKTTAKFDVGLEIGTVGFKTDDVSGAVSFTLANTANNLTLDDITGMRFGAKIDSVGAVGTARTGTQTILATASAAPDAKDDVFTIKEDGATASANMVGGATAPVVTKAVTLNVLANDTDADRDALTIIGLGTGPAHGTVAIAADGKSLLYTPTQDYSGTDSFQYGVSDGKGGTDYATVNLTVTPVADAPVISFTTSAGDHVNETIVHVTARVTDLDGSEVISAITPAGLSADQTLTATGTLHAVAGQAGVYTQDFLLTTAKGQSYHEDLGFTATAMEQANGAVASTMGSTHFDYDAKSVTSAVEFTSRGQNIYTGGAATDVDKFLGFDVTTSDKADFSLGIADLYAGIDTHFAAGITVGLHNITGGDLNAVADYDVTVSSSFNHTADVLQIDTSAALTNLSVSTQSAEGQLYLAALATAYAKVYAGYYIGVDLGPLGSYGGGDDFTLFDTGHIGGTTVLYQGGSDGAHASVDLPGPVKGLSIEGAWPEISTANSGTSSTLVNTGDSNTFLKANLDVDQFLTKLAGTPDFLDFDLSAGPLVFDGAIYKADLSFLMSFKQELTTVLSNLHGLITFEDGSHRDFTAGDTIKIDHASTMDLNHDGQVAYTIDFSQDATFANHTQVGYALQYEQTVGKFDFGIDIDLGIFGSVDESTSIGPLFHDKQDFGLGYSDFYDKSFHVDFSHQSLAFFA